MPFENSELNFTSLHAKYYLRALNITGRSIQLRRVPVNAQKHSFLLNNWFMNEMMNCDWYQSYY